MNTFFNILASIKKVGVPSQPTEPVPEPSITSDTFKLEITSPEHESYLREGNDATITVKSTLTTGSANPFIVEPTDYLHFIAYGQSLAIGGDSSPIISLANVGGNVILDPLTHRFDENTATVNQFSLMQFDPAAPAIEAEGPVLGWANAFKTGLAREIPSSPLNSSVVLGSSTAQGGSSSAQLSKGGLYYPRNINAANMAKSIADSNAKTISCPAILFMQGESEGDTDADAYKGRLLSIFNDLRTDISTIYGQANLPTIIIYQTEPQLVGVREAQVELVEEYDWIVGAGSTFMMPDRGLHLDPNGSRWYGEQVAKAMILSIKQNKKFEPLLIKDVIISGNTLDLVFNKNVFIDTFSRGGTPPALYGITSTLSIIDNVLRYTTDIPDLTTYGDIYLYSKSSNLRDQDSYVATTLYEDYTPVIVDGSPQTHTNDILNEAGQVPYGEPYPMWNWMLDFTKLKLQ